MKFLALSYIFANFDFTIVNVSLFVNIPLSMKVYINVTFNTQEILKRFYHVTYKNSEKLKGVIHSVCSITIYMAYFMGYLKKLQLLQKVPFTLTGGTYALKECFK